MTAVEMKENSSDKRNQPIIKWIFSQAIFLNITGRGCLLKTIIRYEYTDAKTFKVMFKMTHAW